MTTAVEPWPRSPQAERKPVRSGGLAPSVPQAFATEQYRVLGHVVEQLGQTGRSVIAISSPIAGDGKTLTSVNLARSLAQAAEHRILLVDADLRHGSVGQRLGLGRATSLGLAGAIAAAGTRLETVVRHLPALNLWVLPAGPCPAMPYEVLRSPRMGELLAEARAAFDCVLVDTPPVVPVADWRVLGPWVDGVLLVVGAHYTPRALLDEALSILGPDQVVGIVYNGDDLPLSRRYRSYYGYGEPTRRPGFWATLLGPGGRR